jgi:mono/diheme cytochrome c family protein
MILFLLAVLALLTGSLAPKNWADGDAARGRRAFIELKCHACHRVAEDSALPRFEGAWEGPPLRDLGKESVEEVAWKIVTRTHLAAESVYESPMAESASAMSEAQLVDLVAYLRAPSKGEKPTREEKHD